ncbi:MAG: CocE/NonD family hydrolase [Caldilineaceae bacterium]
MQIKTTFPHAIREIENCWIPLADGTRLAARIWLPVDAETHPVPAIFEYLPYRKTDGTAIRDALNTLILPATVTPVYGLICWYR